MILALNIMFKDGNIRKVTGSNLFVQVIIIKQKSDSVHNQSQPYTCLELENLRALYSPAIL